MNTVFEKVQKFLTYHSLDNLKSTYLVAFSGGADSMCLLHILAKILKNKIVAIHLNHNWRGNESDNEEKVCKEFCKNLGIEFYSEKLSSSIPHTETDARNARYEFFEKCAKKFSSNVIFTAHNLNDNVETLIFRICHGTGISGLCGINDVRGMYYRPLSSVFRQDIEQYCLENNLIPNIDSSNKDNIHKRNLIRNEILPLMKEVNPSVLNSINNLSIVAREETEIINQYMDKVLLDISEFSKIITTNFLGLSPVIQKRLLYKIIVPLIPENYDRERLLILLDFIKSNCNSKSGKTCSITTDYWLYVSAKYIEIISSKNISDKVNCHINKVGVYEVGDYIFEIEEYNDKVNYSLNVDLSNFEFDFDIRNRQDGDIIQPMGLNGHQKLKKYLNSHKIPNHEKDDLMFLAKGKEILWAVNVGLSDKIKVKDKPTHGIKFYKKTEQK